MEIGQNYQWIKGGDSVVKLQFKAKDVQEIHNWMRKWEEWRKQTGAAHPDWWGQGIFLMPLTIALINSASTLSRLTWVLLFLTVFLVIERIVWIVKLFL